MIVAVDPQSPVPPYEQVRAQVATFVTDGTLAEGSRLPTVRQLAKELGLAVNTVARAYRELEHAGVVESRGRHGTFVAAAETASERRAEVAARTYVDTARELGLGPAEALRLVERTWVGG